MSAFEVYLGKEGDVVEKLVKWLSAIIPILSKYSVETKAFYPRMKLVCDKLWNPLNKLIKLK